MGVSVIRSSATPQEMATQEGRSFAVVCKDSSSTQQDIVIRAGTTKTVKIERIQPTVGDDSLEIYSEPTESGGTTQNPYNRSVGNATSNECTVVQNPTITGVGNLIDSYDFSSQAEHDFKFPVNIQIEPNKKILIRHAALAASNLVITIFFLEE